MTKKMKILTGISSFYPPLAIISFFISGFLWIGSLMQSLFTGADDSLTPLLTPLTIIILAIFILFPVFYAFNTIYDIYYIVNHDMETSKIILWAVLLIFAGSISAAVFWFIYLSNAKDGETQEDKDPAVID